MSTPTPRTDAECIQFYREDVTGCAEAVDYVAADFARTLERELTAEREKVRVLRSALENLRDEQNDAPLETRREQWQMAMAEAGLALATTEGAK